VPVSQHVLVFGQRIKVRGILNRFKRKTLLRLFFRHQ
jgi:hypothetical protein